MRRHLTKVLRGDTDVVFRGQLDGAYPGNYPGNDIAYSALYSMHGNQWVAAGRAAHRDGFDAYAMCTLPNPMLRELRTLLDIPLIGLGRRLGIWRRCSASDSRSCCSSTGWRHCITSGCGSTGWPTGAPASALPDRGSRT
jgi:hypothetical protein